MTTGQDAVFIGGEGDRWFSRNAAVLADATRMDAPPDVFLDQVSRA
jgi:hypothetical protein